MIYLKYFGAGTIGGLLFLVLRVAAWLLLPAKAGGSRPLSSGPSFWIFTALFFLAGVVLYSQIRGMVFYTAHISR